jgi:predicted CXXCH cytochrome family protein
VPDVSSHIAPPRRVAGEWGCDRAPPGTVWLAGRILAVLIATAVSLAPGCHEGQREIGSQKPSPFYPPPPQTARVVALGTLRGAPPPSSTEVNLSLFLFGAEPTPPLTIARPAGLVVEGQDVLICDAALGAVLRWDAALDRVSFENFEPPLEQPFAIDVLPDGERLICDGQGVRCTTRSGQTVWSHNVAAETFRPGGVLGVGGEVWVSNLALHRIEVFDAASGAYLRFIGEPGRSSGQFILPTGLAHMPDGNVCVVDSLNNRAQIITPQGEFLRSIGKPGDSPGTFGRPKDAAVGPDGVVFVTDTFSQRVHAFTPDGQPLLTFGEPGSGPGALMLPAGIALSTVGPQTEQALPEGTTAEYYIFVAEQLSDPGIRVYAWLGGTLRAEATMIPPSEAIHWKPLFPGAEAINPHWNPDRCTTCHEAADHQMLPIAPESIDGLCLSCHDGVKAPADPHPIGRPAHTDLVDTPADWPTLEGTIGCLTCHDILQHCNPAAQRSASNPMFLRHWDPQRPLQYCSNCHLAEAGQRFSPHRERDASGRIREDACFFCHTERPEIPADGRRTFHPHLRQQTSQICLNCHARHWDLSPRGHVNRPVTPAIREWLLIRELSLSLGGNLEELAELAREAGRQPARLPLGEEVVSILGDGSKVEEIVTCYTCHNPHYTGLFPPGSELGALATNPQDRASALRTNWINLCSECHHR